MPLSGPKSGEQYGIIGTPEWLYPVLIKLQDGYCAERSIPGSFNGWQYTGKLLLYQFPHVVDIPVGSTINGIKIEVKARAETSSVTVMLLALTKDAATQAGNEKGSGGEAILSDVLTYWEMGGETDLWGTTWTRDELCSGTYGVLARAANFDIFEHTVYVDHIRSTVWYTEPSGKKGFLTLLGVGT